MSDPEPWPEAVDGAELADAIRRELARFVVMPGPSIDACALWACMTWVMESLYLLPILVIGSPQKRCGKSTLLLLLRHLTRRALLAANTSSAALFRTVEKHCPTLLLDEADAWLRENEELRGIINSGHCRDTAVVIRVTGENLEPTPFSTFCPKAIAGIGALADTIEDRSIKIELRRRAPNESVERLRQDRLDYTELKRKLMRWAVDYASRLRSIDPSVPKELHDRAADNWRPLLAIADLCGGDWPQRARSAAIAMALRNADADDIGTTLLADLRDILTDHPRIASTRVIELLVQREDRPWSEWKAGRAITTVQLSRLLKPYGIGPKTHRIDGDVVKGYIVDQFEDTFTRYLPGITNRAVTELQMYDFQRNSAVPSVTQESRVTVRTVTDDLPVTDKEAIHAEKNSKCNSVTDRIEKTEVAVV